MTKMTVSYGSSTSSRVSRGNESMIDRDISRLNESVDIICITNGHLLFVMGALIL